ncbi:MAG: hypothetical protein QXN26_01065 [Thermoplasmataceae archaeon]
MYQVAISSAIPVLAYAGIALMSVGTAGIITFVVLSLRDRERKKRVYRLLSIIFAMILITGLPIYIVQGISGSHAEISIGTGFVDIHGPYIGNMNFTDSQVRYAFMEDIDTGNVTVTIRDAGTSIGNLNEGIFTLSNGAKAYVVTDNATSLVISLDSGKFLIIGSQDSQSMADYFSSNVHSVSGL